MNLQQEQVNQLISEGYTMQEIQDAYADVEAESNPLMQSYQATQQQGGGRQANSIFGVAENENIAKWQLNPDEILERQEHLLRGDKITIRNGEKIWIPAEKDEDRLFNDYGVSQIMRILSSYLNNNTLLSNYSEEEIRVKVYNFGLEISDLIYMKYQEFGLDTIEKRKEYPMIVWQLKDVVHSAYLRAMNGGERSSIRTMMTVQQSDNLSPYGTNINVNSGYGQQPRQRSVLNPMRWFGGKYK